jgi:hypothetical protein
VLAGLAASNILRFWKRLIKCVIRRDSLQLLSGRQGLPKRSKGTSMARGIPCKSQEKKVLIA